MHIHHLHAITLFYGFLEPQVNIVIFYDETSLCKGHAFQINIADFRITFFGQTILSLV